MTEPRVVQLTRRERQIVGELANDGPRDAVIAERLGITDHTVKTHIKNALRESGCSTRTELVCALFRRRIVIKTVVQRRRDH